MAEVLGSGVDVVVDGRHVRNADLLACGGPRQDLHDADGTGSAHDVLIEAGLLVGLSGEHERVEVIDFSVLAKDGEQPGESFPLPAGEGVLDVLRVLEIALDERVADQASRSIRLDETIHMLFETSGALSHRPTQLPSAGDGEIVAGDDVRQHPRPESSQIVVGNCDLDQTGIDHLQEVLGFEILAGGDDLDLLETAFTKRRIELFEALPVAARFTDNDSLTRKVIDAGEFGRVRTGHNQFADILRAGYGEIHLPRSLGGDGERGDGHIATPFFEEGKELISHDRNRRDLERATPELEFLIERFLELTQHVGGDSPLGAAIEEEVGHIVGDQHPDLPFLDHGVKVTMKGSEHFLHHRRQLDRGWMVRNSFR